MQSIRRVSSSSPHCAAILNQRQAPFSASDWCQGRATPKLVNSDGEGIVFSETRFPIADRVRSAAIEKRLDGLAELVREEADRLAWTWLSAAPPSGSLPAGPRKAIMLKTYDGRGGQVLGSVRLDPAAVVLSGFQTGRGLAQPQLHVFSYLLHVTQPAGQRRRAIFMGKHPIVHLV